MKAKHSIVILINIIFLFNLISCHKLPNYFKCMHSTDEENNPLPNRVVETPVNQNGEQRRRVDDTTDTDEFKEFNIYLDLTNIEYEIGLLGLKEHEDFFISSMQKAVDVLKSLLKVKPLREEYQLNDHDFQILNISKWDTEKFGTNASKSGKSFKTEDIDLAIFGKFEDLGESTLATASARAFQNTTIRRGQPYIGVVKINKNVNYLLPNSKIYFQSILVHEFTHILGFSKKFFEDYYQSLVYKKDKYGINRYYLNSSILLKKAKKYFGCDTIEGVELENQGGEGTAASHWEARILLGEYMNGYAYTEEQVISEFTLAVLEDSGYYQPNYYTGGLMRFGKNKGCEFLTEKCINSTTEKTNENFENEFYDTINKYKSIESTCSSGRQSRTYKAWWEVGEIEKEYKYFQRDGVGGYAPADYCPVSLKYQAEEDLAYFSGHCSSIGSKIYGSVLQYPSSKINGTSAALLEKTGEVFNDTSFCFLSSLIKNTFPDGELSSFVVRANCYEISCSSKSLTLKIFDDYIVCPRAGGKIKVDGYYGYLLCPDYNLMCTGTKICNDMFDCIEKKSEAKEGTFDYDYVSRTTQNYEKIQKYYTDNYELADDGDCPKNCSQCKENKKCYKCAEGYGLIKETNGKFICKSLDELSGYYKNTDTNIYEKCMDNCVSCSDKETCDACEDKHIYQENDQTHQYECIYSDKYIPNCLKYNITREETHCLKCNAGYGFKGTNKSECLSLNDELASYYSKDNGISYYPCSNYDTKCNKCYYQSAEIGVVCTGCKDNLILLDKRRGVCTTKEVIENNTRYFKINDTHAGDCNKVFNNCISCTNDFICDTCKYGYTFVPGDNNIDGKSECVPKKKEAEYIKSVGSEAAKEIESQNKAKIIDNRRRRKKNGSNYFSIINILSLQAVYLVFLLINF